MKKLIFLLITTAFIGCSKEVIVKGRSYKDGQAYFIYNRPIWLFKVKTDYTGDFYHNSVFNKKTKELNNIVYFPANKKDDE